MQDTSVLYRQIIQDESHWFETAVVIGESGNLVTDTGDLILFGGTAIVVSHTGPDSGFSESQLLSVSTSIQMFESATGVGQAVSQEINIEMLRPTGDLPLMAAIIPYVRACTVSAQSEWIQQGVFYIDTREISENDNDLQIITLHGFDAMMMTEQDYATTKIDWPAKDIEVVQEIASKIGVSVDVRTVALMTDGYNLPLPTGYTLREMLRYIASMYIGCFIITDIGELRLVSLLDLPKETNILIDNYGDHIVFGLDKIKV